MPFKIELFAPKGPPLVWDVQKGEFVTFVSVTRRLNLPAENPNPPKSKTRVAGAGV